MEFIVQDIIYTDEFSSNAKLVEIQQEGQTYDYIPQNQLNAQTYTLSVRNGANVYIVPTNQENIYANFIGKKRFVLDSELSKYIDVEFGYFVPDPIIPEELFTLPDGFIFRCVSVNSLPKPKEDYTYYIMVEGIAKLIPNYRTLEVMLHERNETLLAVKVLTEDQCTDIPKQGSVPDKSMAWSDVMSDKTSMEVLVQLNQNVQSGAGIAAAASAAAQGQIDTVKAQAAADKAAADAAKAASDAAIAQANAAKADADAKKAQLDLQLQQLNTK